MKLIFGYSGQDNRFEIKSHAGLFYLFKNNKKIARSDNEEKLRSYIDGFSDGHEDGAEKERRDFESGKLIIYNGQTRLARLVKN